MTITIIRMQYLRLKIWNIDSPVSHFRIVFFFVDMARVSHEYDSVNDIDVCFIVVHRHKNVR